MTPDMVHSDPAALAGVAVGLWLLVAYVFGKVPARVRAYRAKRAGMKRRG